MQTRKKYLQLAKHFAEAADSTRDNIARQQLEALANSYFVLAKSTSVAERSAKTIDDLD
jgi:hypothetical protein